MSDCTPRAHLSRDCGVHTTLAVAVGAQPVLFVMHLEDSSQWICTASATESFDHVASFGKLLDRDATLAELADLPPGWCASRLSLEHAWSRSSTLDGASAFGDRSVFDRCA